jgi:hypothetical protein
MLTEQDIAKFYEEKAEARRRDRQAVLEGKLRAEDLSWAHLLNFGKFEIDFSKVEAALEREDDSSWADD